MRFREQDVIPPPVPLEEIGSIWPTLSIVKIAVRIVDLRR